MAAHPPDFDRIFTAGARFRWSGRPDSVQEILPVGELNLPTGRLMACDPLWGGDQVTAFTTTVAAGRYPVMVAIARWDEPADPNLPGPLRLVAAAKVVIREEPVASWGPARRENDPDDDNRAYGFGVDSGTGCFLDASAVPALVRLGGPPDGLLWTAVQDTMTNCAVNVTDPESNHNFVVFGCGMGDGAYPTWLGRTDNGEPACFVADLSVMHYSFGPRMA